MKLSSLVEHVSNNRRMAGHNNLTPNEIMLGKNVHAEGELRTKAFRGGFVCQGD